MAKPTARRTRPATPATSPIRPIFPTLSGARYEPPVRARVHGWASGVGATAGAAADFSSACAVGVGERGDGGVAGELEGPDVGRDGPAVLGGDLARVARHLPEAVRHDVEEVAEGLRAEPVDVVRGGLLEAALDDHPLAVPLASVAGRAEDVEPLAPADEESLVERRRRPGARKRTSRRGRCRCRGPGPRGASRARPCRPAGCARRARRGRTRSGREGASSPGCTSPAGTRRRRGRRGRARRSAECGPYAPAFDSVLNFVDLHGREAFEETPHGRAVELRVVGFDDEEVAVLGGVLDEALAR